MNIYEYVSSCAFGTKDEKERKKKKNRNNERVVVYCAKDAPPLFINNQLRVS
jgi:hypothetical protein